MVKANPILIFEHYSRCHSLLHNLTIPGGRFGTETGRSQARHSL